MNVSKKSLIESSRLMSASVFRMPLCSDTHSRRASPRDQHYEIDINENGARAGKRCGSQLSLTSSRMQLRHRLHGRWRNFLKRVAVDLMVARLQSQPRKDWPAWFEGASYLNCCRRDFPEIGDFVLVRPGSLSQPGWERSHVSDVPEKMRYGKLARYHFSQLESRELGELFKGVYTCFLQPVVNWIKLSKWHWLSNAAVCPVFGTKLFHLWLWFSMVVLLIKGLDRLDLVRYFKSSHSALMSVHWTWW